ANSRGPATAVRPGASTLDAALLRANISPMDERDPELNELRRSLARVVAASDAERRRIERALHDGVQQHLVAVAVNLQLVRKLVGSGQAALSSLLDEIGSEVHE